MADCEREAEREHASGASLGIQMQSSIGRQLSLADSDALRCAQMCSDAPPDWSSLAADQIHTRRAPKRSHRRLRQAPKRAAEGPKRAAEGRPSSFVVAPVGGKEEQKKGRPLESLASSPFRQLFFHEQLLSQPPVLINFHQKSLSLSSLGRQHSSLACQSCGMAPIGSPADKEGSFSTH